MKTTLNEIRKYHPCKSGWEILLKSLNKTQADNELLDLMYILKSNGIEDAVWCLRCFDYLDYCLFLADVAESVLPIHEKSNTNNQASRSAIQAIRDYKANKITVSDLGKTREAAAAYAAATAYAADAAATAYAAAAAAAYATDAAATAYAATAARKQKWQEIEQLFIKHFGE